jgi:hypothetical protein
VNTRPCARAYWIPTGRRQLANLSRPCRASALPASQPPSFRFNHLRRYCASIDQRPYSLCVQVVKDVYDPDQHCPTYSRVGNVLEQVHFTLALSEHCPLPLADISLHTLPKSTEYKQSSIESQFIKTPQLDSTDLTMMVAQDTQASTNNYVTGRSCLSHVLPGTCPPIVAGNNTSHANMTRVHVDQLNYQPVPTVDVARGTASYLNNNRQSNIPYMSMDVGHTVLAAPTYNSHQILQPRSMVPHNPVSTCALVIYT